MKRAVLVLVAASMLTVSVPASARIPEDDWMCEVIGMCRKPPVDKNACVKAKIFFLGRFFAVFRKGCS
jgi:hypothetical protein